MIDWRRRGLELAGVVNRHQKDRMLNDRDLGWKIAKELLRLAKIEDKAKKKFLEWYHCKDKKKYKPLYEEYLELVRSVNEEVKNAGR